MEKKHSRRSARQFHRDNQFTPSQIYASVYTQEKFTLKFYLTNAIIKDKKIDVDFAPERILEKEKRGCESFFHEFYFSRLKRVGIIKKSELYVRSV